MSTSTLACTVNTHANFYFDCKCVSHTVTLADGTPARRERIQFVDTITWRNPRTNASLTWTVPREEVRVVPVVWQ